MTSGSLTLETLVLLLVGLVQLQCDSLCFRLYFMFLKKQDKQTNNNQTLSRLKERKDSWPNPLKSTRSSDAGLQLTGLQRHLKPLLCFMLRKSSEVSPCHSSKLAHLRTFSPPPPNPLTVIIMDWNSQALWVPISSLRLRNLGLEVPSGLYCAVLWIGLVSEHLCFSCLF